MQTIDSTRPRPRRVQRVSRAEQRLSLIEAWEDARLRAHFADVIAELRSADVAHLDDGRRERRAAVLAELAAYAARGRFPRNQRFVDRVPHFIDDAGTTCAVAHLATTFGAAAVVAELARTHNYARVPTLARHPGLARWLEHHGLTVAEATRIQPAYCDGLTMSMCFCGSDAFEPWRMNPEVVMLVTGVDASSVRVDRVWGDTSLASVGQVLPITGVSGTLFVGARRDADSGELKAMWSETVNADGSAVQPSCGGYDGIPDAPLETLASALVGPRCNEDLVAANATFGEYLCKYGDPGAEIARPVEAVPEAVEREVVERDVVEGGDGCSYGAPPLLPGFIVAGFMITRRRWRARRAR